MQPEVVKNRADRLLPLVVEGEAVQGSCASLMSRPRMVPSIGILLGASRREGLARQDYHATGGWAAACRGIESSNTGPGPVSVAAPIFWVGDGRRRRLRDAGGVIAFSALPLYWRVCVIKRADVLG